MNCTDAQDIMEKLHDESGGLLLGQPNVNLAMEHLATCDTCEIWFRQNVCTDNSMGLGMLTLHEMIHGNTGRLNCPKQP